ncbi:retrovirus-related pol polyprotein from transposon TNT 1-94 [Tanacetum coccineum]
MCSACALGKSKKISHQPKAEDTNQEKLYLLHMDLCGPMRVESIYGKKYILVIVDDYSRFTWVKFLRSKDEAPDAIIKCIKNIQVRLNATVRSVRTYNGTEVVNQTLPPLFPWAKAINTACYTQNRSLIRLHYNKTPYELMHDKKPDLSFLHVFGLLCYPTNDSEDLGKLNAKADIGVFVGYAPAKKAFRIYNRRTRKIMETIHVTFDELTAMASEQFNLGPGLQSMAPATSSSGLVPNPNPQQPCNPPKRYDWDRLFQLIFNEYFNPLSDISLVPVVVAPRAVDIADSPVSTSIDLDAPSTSILTQHQEQEHSPLISLKVLKNHQKHPRLRWTKDHPLANVIGNPSRPLSTRKQLETDAMWCYFNAFLTSIEPKNFKQAMTELDSIDTPMVEKNKQDEDLQGTPVDATHYHGMIGSLMYLTSSRPDLIYADTGMSLTAYSDADHARCQDTRHSTSGSAQFLSDKLVSWSSKKQKSTAMSSTEAEYIALSSAIALCCNNVQHSRAKHIDVRYHFINEQVENEIVELYFVRTEYQLADIFTKPLPRERFTFLIDKLGMRSMSSETLKRLTKEEDE